jgi:hypothetical protein
MLWFCAIAAEPSIRNTRVVISLRIRILHQQRNASPGGSGSRSFSNLSSRHVDLDHHEFGG